MMHTKSKRIKLVMNSKLLQTGNPWLATC